MRQEQQESSAFDAQADAKQATEQLRQATEQLRQASEKTAAQYDVESAQKIIALAGRIQNQRQEMMTVEQIESIATEVGVDPQYVREALVAAREEDRLNLSTMASVAHSRATNTSQIADNILRTLSSFGESLLNMPPKLWWSVGWMIVPVTPLLVFLLNLGGRNYVWTGVMPFVYIAVGIILSLMAKNRAQNPSINSPNTPNNSNAPVSRQELLGQLFAIQRELASARVRRAFLSLDVVGSTQMKKENSELKVEYSFGQYQQWVREIVESEGGKFQSAAGDGVMCVFDSDLPAIRAGQRLLQDLSRFNNTQNQCKTPFQIRCGVHAGDIAIEEGGTIGSLQSPVLDYTAALQKQASPNSLAASGSLTEPALARIGQGSTNHEAVFLWKTP
jgi:class 3 adenylate cyclase